MSKPAIWKPFIGILCIWTLVILWIAPWGNYPLNDDWAYARQVLTFLETGKIEHSAWAAMPFLPQSFFGIALGKLFGFSFVTLRIGTLAIAVLNSLLLYRLLHRHSMPAVAFGITLLFVFNPISLYLSMSYMTEVYYLFFLLLMLSLMERYLQSPSWSVLGMIALASMGAVLQRQTGLIIPMSFALLYLIRKDRAGKEKLQASVPFLCTLAAMLLYGYWRTQAASGHDHYAHFTDIFASLLDFRLSFFLERGGILLLYLGLFTAPLLLLLSWKRVLPTAFGWITLSLFIVLLAFALPNFPRNQVLFNFGIGPRLLKDTMAHQFPYFPQVAYYIVGGLSAIVVLLFAHRILTYCSFGMKAPLEKIRVQSDPWKVLVALALSGYGMYLLLNLIFFDRYMLPLLLLVLIFSSLFIQKILRQRIFYPALGLLLVLNCILLRDHFLWQTTRWEAISHTEKMGINAKIIDAGFEYNCWHNGDPLRSKDDDMHLKGWWSVFADNYMLSEDEMENYTPLRYFPYDPLIGPKDSLVLSIRTSLLRERP